MKGKIECDYLDLFLPACSAVSALARQIYSNRISKWGVFPQSRCCCCCCWWCAMMTKNARLVIVRLALSRSLFSLAPLCLSLCLPFFSSSSFLGNSLHGCLTPLNGRSQLAWLAWLLESTPSFAQARKQDWVSRYSKLRVVCLHHRDNFPEWMKRPRQQNNSISRRT